MEPIHIFISYSRKDTRELAFALSDALNALPNVTAWVDRSLRAGPSWETQIQTEIRKCDYFLVLYSPDLNRHLNGEEESYVLTEISYAKYTLKKPIIPVMAQKTDPPISLTQSHYIDYTLPGLTLADLIEAISAEIEIASSQPDLSPHSPPEYDSPIHSGATMVKIKPRSFDLLPQPFAWVEIPSGHGTLKTDNAGVTLAIPEQQYWIAKYPVTNRQFKLFIDADGYRERKWWTDAGWAQREEEKWTEPRYWGHSEWNGNEQPVVCVSWYEAVAFCRWLSDTTGESIMLPTEAQWQYAAQSDDGRAYPWGKQWDCKRCNNSVKPCKSNVTTPVRQYEGKEKGDSPFGVADMAGNVWEWCLTAYEGGHNDLDGTDLRLLRGGSWQFDSSVYFCCNYRNRGNPDYWVSSWGFRIISS
jgi:formylglycine-generating enzyme required for sulfatase activity